VRLAERGVPEAAEVLTPTTGGSLGVDEVDVTDEDEAMVDIDEPAREKLGCCCCCCWACC